MPLMGTGSIIRNVVCNQSSELFIAGEESESMGVINSMAIERVMYEAPELFPEFTKAIQMQRSKSLIQR